MREGAGPEHNTAVGAGQKLSGGRAVSLVVDMDGRSGARRSGQDHRFPLAGPSQLGGQKLLSPRQGQLPPHRRQPARPDPPPLPPPIPPPPCPPSPTYLPP